MAVVKAEKWKCKMSTAGEQTDFLSLCSSSISCTTIPGRVLWCSDWARAPFHLGRGTRDKIICLNAETLKEIMRRSTEDMLNRWKRKERKENSQHRMKTEA